MKKKIAIIGGGPSSLLLAAFLDTDLFDITIFEKNKSFGRKFLVAGKGGFNLTHSETIETFIERYTPSIFLEKSLSEFNNQDLIQWFTDIGIPTFVGSSKRVFPLKGIKPIEVLNAILQVLKDKKIDFQFEQTWIGWNEDEKIIFQSGLNIQTDYVVFALGGGSWKVTGSDGQWLDIFSNKGIKTLPFKSANCAYKIQWPEHFISKNEGKPLKNISATCGSKIQKGEAVITRFGLEGNAIYALSPQIQKELDAKKSITIFLDLKPSLSEEIILKKLTDSKLKKTSDKLRGDIKLSTIQLSLLKSYSKKEDFLDHKKLSQIIKKLPLDILSAAPIDEAISTTGGINLKEVNEHFQLKKIDRTFCIGEMLDWNAPTGGYLLQACFSMGVYLARYLNNLEMSE